MLLTIRVSLNWAVRSTVRLVSCAVTKALGVPLPEVLQAVSGKDVLGKKSLKALASLLMKQRQHQTSSHTYNDSVKSVASTKKGHYCPKRK